MSDSSLGSSNSVTNIYSFNNCKEQVSPTSADIGNKHSTSGLITNELSLFLPGSLSKSASLSDTAASNNEDDRLKVPPLKIICSQSSNGGLPYVKPISLQSEPEGFFPVAASGNEVGSLNKPITRSKAGFNSNG